MNRWSLRPVGLALGAQAERVGESPLEPSHTHTPNKWRGCQNGRQSRMGKPAKGPGFLEPVSRGLALAGHGGKSPLSGTRCASRVGLGSCAASLCVDGLAFELTDLGIGSWPSAASSLHSDGLRALRAP